MSPAGGAPEAAALLLRTQSAAETRALGERLGRLLRGGDVVALHGELGAGKTTLVQGIVAGLGVPVHATSPTFALVNEYRARDGATVVHVDVYRLNGSGDNPNAAAAEAEVESLGLEEYLGAADAIVLVEWAERIAGWLPEGRLGVRLEAPPDGEGRTITLGGAGPRVRAILNALESQ